MPLSRYYMILLFSFLVVSQSSCSGREQRLCDKDKFFCQDDWEKKVKDLASDRIYSLDSIHNSVTGGGNAYLEAEFGARGEEAIRTIIRRGGDSNFDHHLMVSQLDNVKEQSGIDACREPYRRELMEIVEDNSQNRDKTNQGPMDKSVLQIYCGS